MSFQPAMTGDVKSLAGVRVPSKIAFVMASRSIDIEIAWRRRMPSSPEKCSSFSGMVKDWNTAEAWFTARPLRSPSNVENALSGTASRTSRLFASRSVYAVSCDV